MACTTVAALALWAASGCSRQARTELTIEFTKLPRSGDGSPFQIEAIEGRVSGAQPGERIVLFARAGVWWVQPLADKPFTAIQNSKWRGSTHPGGAYAALLVKSSHRLPRLPNSGLKKVVAY